MQSWGELSKWSIRATNREPTKSGVVGLLACALGCRDDLEIRTLSKAIQIGVRCDRPGTVMVDYHIVGGGYSEPQLQTAKGRSKESHGRPHVEVTHRYYSCDASFLVVVQSEDFALIARLADAVQSPVWPIYLGRRCCPPSRPIYDGVGNYASLIIALQSKPIFLRRKTRSKSVQLRAVVESGPGVGIRHRDETDIRSMRTFLPRYTQEVWLKASVEKEA